MTDIFMVPNKHFLKIEIYIKHKKQSKYSLKSH